MLYERGNAAKQWMLQELDGRYGPAAFSVLDLGCGSGRIWKTFVETHPAAHIVGVDTDQQAIEKGKVMYAAHPNVDLRILDAQKPLTETFDVVVAMSAIEHVVDRPAFLRTVYQALRTGGMAYLNYDDGHFRSHDLKERLMVPVSQLLALVGIEGPYMKHVDDAMFEAQAVAQGFRVINRRKHNLHPLKGFMRGADDAAIEAWYAFEEQVNTHVPYEKLDKVMWSTTLVLEKV